MDHNYGYNPRMESTRQALLQQSALLYGRATRVLDPMRMQVWENMGLSLPQLRILFRVRARPGVDLGGLASALSISASAASQQVEKLVERGMLSRQPDLNDRRRLSLELTERGRLATRAISSAAHEYLEQLLDNLNDDELAELHRVLSHILELAIQTPFVGSFSSEDDRALEPVEA